MRRLVSRALYVLVRTVGGSSGFDSLTLKRIKWKCRGCKTRSRLIDTNIDPAGARGQPCTTSTFSRWRRKSLFFYFLCPRWPRLEQNKADFSTWVESFTVWTLEKSLRSSRLHKVRGPETVWCWRKVQLVLKERVWWKVLNRGLNDPRLLIFSRDIESFF